MEQPKINKPENVVTPRELEKLYGKEVTEFMDKLHGEVIAISSPLIYMTFIKIFSYCKFQRDGKEKYEEIISTYNENIVEKFGEQVKESNESTRFAASLVKNFPLLIGMKTIEGYQIKNQHNEALKKVNSSYQFSQEVYLEDAIFEQIKNWDENFKVERQVKVDGGRLDLLIESDETLMIVELKKDKVKGRHLYQVFDYMLSYPDDYPKKIEMIVMGYEFTEHALRVAKRLGITCIQYAACQCIKSPYMFLEFQYISKPECKTKFKEFLTDCCQGDDGFLIDHPLFKENPSQYATRILKERDKQMEQDRNRLDYIIQSLQTYIDAKQTN